MSISAKEYAELAGKLQDLARPLQEPSMTLSEARGHICFFLERAAKLASQCAVWKAEKEAKIAGAR